MESISLYNGVRMPLVGYGVYQLDRESCEECVYEALKTGYRMIDTAVNYANEDAVAKAIQKSGIDRSEIFLTTKIGVEYYGYEAARNAVLGSLERLNTDYIDLYLLHMPFYDIYGSWRALEAFYREGRIRAIGVSNFYEDRITEFALYTKVRPMVNQIERHIFHQNQKIIEWSAKYDIRTEAYAPFGHGNQEVFKNPVIGEIASRHGRTPSQIMLRWQVQSGIPVIPKSTNPERMRANLEVFDFALTNEEMERIGTLDKGETVFFSHRDPAKIAWYKQMVDERQKKRQ